MFYINCPYEPVQNCGTCISQPCLVLFWFITLDSWNKAALIFIVYLDQQSFKSFNKFCRTSFSYYFVGRWLPIRNEPSSLVGWMFSSLLVNGKTACNFVKYLLFAQVLLWNWLKNVVVTAVVLLENSQVNSSWSLFLRYVTKIFIT